MSVTAITLLIFACLVILLISGLPIAFCMGGVAALFTLLLWSPASLGVIFSVAYGVTDNFVLIAIPLFVFMGMILQHSGVAEEAYDIMYKWIGQVRGGLAIGTVAVCTIFAACVGISAAACVTMGVIALPAMFKHNYDKSIAIGSIAAGAGLGILIPPSVLMIVYGVFASESIGKLFAAGVFPGLLLAALKKRLTWDMIKEACYSTQRLSCMVVWLIIGGSCFASLYTARMSAMTILTGWPKPSVRRCTTSSKYVRPSSGCDRAPWKNQNVKKTLFLKWACWPIRTAPAMKTTVLRLSGNT
jgi:TRAP-type mannitol/chloroaromatic compound transport system permease large subunit